MNVHHKGEIIDTIDGFDIIDCSRCGFKHVYPLPTEKELIDNYTHNYYQKEKPLSIKRHIEDKEWHQLQYDDRYETFEKKREGKTGRILDIGSGPGFFLKTGRDRGWETLGIEPSTQAASHARSLDLKIIENFFEEASTETLGFFDVVHASLVIEHIPNPQNFISLARSILNPGGLICLTAPNDYNPFQNVLRSVKNYSPWWIVPTHHLNYFTPNTLASLVEKTGFTVFFKETTFPMDIFLLMGDNYIGNDELGRQCHKKRMEFEKNLVKAGNTQIKRSLYQSFSDMGIGREIIIYAEKE